MRTVVFVCQHGAAKSVLAAAQLERLAAEHGIDLSNVTGTGPGGRIVRDDIAALLTGAPRVSPAPDQAAPPAPVQAPAAAPAAAPVTTPSGRPDGIPRELSKIRRTTGRRMAESKAAAPHFYVTSEIDMVAAAALREQINAQAPDDASKISFNDLIVKASALALREFPRANGAYRDGKFELYSRVNVGIAVAAQDALIVPTIFDADRKSLGEISRDARALAERVRAGTVTPPELSSGTFTVSNLGMYGIHSFVAVINPPQAAILAVGALGPAPVVRDGELVVRNVMRVTLSCDHRILYGADAAAFLGRIRERLENPLQLAL